MVKTDLRQEKHLTARKVIFTAFVVDILDVLLSSIVAITSGSIVMFTQVLEGLSDLASSGLLLIGVHRSLKQDDKSHPFGYGREIYFWTLMAGLVMFGVTSTLSIYFGWQRFLHPEPIKDLTAAFGVLLLTTGTNGYAFFLSYRRLLRRRSPKHIVEIFYRSSLVETKTTFILDLMGTIASIFGIIALLIYVITGNEQFDGLGAFIIGIVLAVLAIFLLEGIRDLLVGKSATPETEHNIRKAALAVHEVDDVLDIKTLHVGAGKLLVNLDVHMSAKLTTRELERLIDEIKAKVREVVPTVKYLQVELETPRVEEK